jgi:hypothetical protein
MPREFSPPFGKAKSGLRKVPRVEAEARNFGSDYKSAAAKEEAWVEIGESLQLSGALIRRTR